SSSDDVEDDKGKTPPSTGGRSQSDESRSSSGDDSSSDDDEDDKGKTPPLTGR
ncbi:unnamed protein product, partial [Ectocarpus sp. 8 AP-2014]